MLKKLLYFSFTIVSLASCSQTKTNTINVETFQQGIQQNNIQLLDELLYELKKITLSCVIVHYSITAFLLL
jgi:hypothetical protein